jgi:hypothetical protein
LVISDPQYSGIHEDFLLDLPAGVPKRLWWAWIRSKAPLDHQPYLKISNVIFWLTKNKVSFCILGEYAKRLRKHEK